MSPDQVAGQPIDAGVVENDRRVEVDPEPIIQVFDETDAEDGVQAIIGEGLAMIDAVGGDLEGLAEALKDGVGHQVGHVRSGRVRCGSDATASRNTGAA